MRILEEDELKMVNVNGREMTLPEYITYIHGLSWEGFITESVVRSGTHYVLALYNRAVESKAKVIVELGSMIGQSTRALLKATIENNGHMYSIESNGDSLLLIGAALRSGGLDTSFWTPLHGDDLEVVKGWMLPIDLILIDTSHTYEQTLKELDSYLKFVVPQGIVILHDIYGGTPNPVKQAVDDWMKLHGEWMFEDITPKNDGWGLGLLRRVQT